MCEADGYGDGIIFASFVCSSLAEHGERSPASSKGNQPKRSSSERALRQADKYVSLVMLGSMAVKSKLKYLLVSSVLLSYLQNLLYKLRRAMVLLSTITT